jgi:hypothetical protein
MISDKIIFKKLIKSPSLINIINYFIINIIYYFITLNINFIHLDFSFLSM